MAVNVRFVDGTEKYYARGLGFEPGAGVRGLEVEGEEAGQRRGRGAWPLMTSVSVTCADPNAVTQIIAGAERREQGPAE